MSQAVSSSHVMNLSESAIRALRDRVDTRSPITFNRSIAEKALTPWDMMDDEDSSLGVTFSPFQRRPAVTSAA